MIKKTVLSFIIFSFLVACAGIPQNDELYSLPTPESGQSIIHGSILSEDKQPISGKVIRLAKVYGEGEANGTYILDDAHSPSTISESNGTFLFLNVLPGDYVLFIGRLDDSYIIVSDREQVPNVYSVEENESLEIEPIILIED